MRLGMSERVVGGGALAAFEEERGQPEINLRLQERDGQLFGRFAGGFQPDERAVEIAASACGQAQIGADVRGLLRVLVPLRLGVIATLKAPRRSLWACSQNLLVRIHL